MAQKSNIQWTDATWNIARGCTKVDEDCRYCYMYRDSFNSTRYNPLNVVKTKTVFNLPLRIKKPSKIFTSSLTDVFHEAIDEYRNDMWDIIRACPQHTFQILTKRPERISTHLPEDWGEGWDNVWLGTSVGNPKGMKRIEDLVKVDSKIKFLSLEPLWGKVELPVDWADGSGMVDWVIVGGESGNETGKYRYRPCELSWIEDIVAQCRRTGAAVFIKQMGTHLAKELKMTDRHGGNIEEFPKYLQIREFPIKVTEPA